MIIKAYQELISAQISLTTSANVAFAPFLFLALVLTEVPHSQVTSLFLILPQKTHSDFCHLPPAQTLFSHSAVPANNYQHGAMSHLQVHFYALLNTAPVKGFFASSLSHHAPK